MKTHKQIAGLVLAVAIWPKAVSVCPADWAEPGEPNPDLSLAGSNNYWLRTDEDGSGLYLQVRDHDRFLSWSASTAHCLKEAVDQLEKQLAIKVRLPWTRIEIDEAWLKHLKGEMKQGGGAA